MATIEQFNEAINQFKQRYAWGVVAMRENGHHEILSVRLFHSREALPVFQDAVETGHYEHVALVCRQWKKRVGWLGHSIMAIWHAQPATGTAQAFGVGDLVTIKPDAKVNHPYKVMLQQARTVGEVVDFDGKWSIVEFEGGAADDGISFLPEELELWKPAEPGSDAPAEDELETLRAELVTFAIVIHQCVGLSELMLAGYDTVNGNALLKRAEALAEPVGE